MTLSTGILVAITCVGVFLIIVIIFQFYKYWTTKIRDVSNVNRRSATVAPASRTQTPDHGDIVLATMIRQPVLAVASPQDRINYGKPHQFSSRSSIATAPPVSSFNENLRRQIFADFPTPNTDLQKSKLSSSSTSPAEKVHKNAVCEGCLKRLSISELAAHKSTCPLVFIECRYINFNFSCVLALSSICGMCLLLSSFPLNLFLLLVLENVAL